MTDAPAPEMSGRDVLRRVVDILTKVIDEGYDTEPNAVAIALRRLEEAFRDPPGKLGIETAPYAMTFSDWALCLPDAFIKIALERGFLTWGADGRLSPVMPASGAPNGHGVDPNVTRPKKPDPVLDFADRLRTSVGFLRGAFGSEDRADGALLDVLDLISELVRDYKKGRL